ncbi:hypothetical protein OY671_010296, partial [Metschnikowia pulcherrima]
YKPGFKTMISQIYSPDDEHSDSDVQFGVTRASIGDFRRHDAPSDGLAAPWYSLDQHFVSEAGEARRPSARNKVMYGGVAEIDDDAATRDCVVRNISDHGATIEFSNVVRSP